VKAWVDGSTTRIAYVLCDCSGVVLSKQVVRLDHKVTGNEGEYLAAMLMLAHEAPEGCGVHIFCDSLLVAKQMSGEFRVRKPNMRCLKAELDSIIRSLKLTVTFEWIPREANQAGWLLE